MPQQWKYHFALRRSSRPGQSEFPVPESQPQTEDTRIVYGSGLLEHEPIFMPDWLGAGFIAVDEALTYWAHRAVILNALGAGGPNGSGGSANSTSPC